MYSRCLTDTDILISDENVEHSSKNAEDNFFDEIIGYIEDILLGTYIRNNIRNFYYLKKSAFSEDEFHAIQNKFLDKYWNVFEPIEENKLIYTDIFNEYVSSIVI